MKEILRTIIYKYTNIKINDDKQNLLDLPIMPEYWLYFISEIEEEFHIPIIQVIEELESDNFTLEKICGKIQSICEQNNLRVGGDKLTKIEN